MLRVTVAGRLGRDAEHKQTQSGTDLCAFVVATDVGYGENKQTYWVDVTKWGKGAQGLAGILRKGSSVAVIGELTTREHNGKTYLQCRADDVTILGAPKGDGSRGGPVETQTDYDDLGADEIPFLTRDSIF